MGLLGFTSGNARFFMTALWPAEHYRSIEVFFDLSKLKQMTVSHPTWVSFATLGGFIDRHGDKNDINFEWVTFVTMGDYKDE